MKGKKTLFALMMVFLLLLTACANDSNQINNAQSTDEASANETAKSDEQDELLEKIKEYEVEIEELKGKIEDFKVMKKGFEEEITAYQDFNEKMLAYLNEEEVLSLAKETWHYQILVDEKPIPENGELQITKNDFEIVFSEGVAAYQTLPGEVINQGKISGEYGEHLVFPDQQPGHISRTDGTVITAFIYQFEDIPSSTPILIEISDELKERIGIQSNTITITIQ